jgi:aryl-alcohol dehydrogenase-like predicted oxidoreductase
MIYRRLGRTGLMVSEIGFGGLAIGGVRWGDVRDEESLAALQRAFDLGVNFFDTADIYGRGHSEELIAQALGEVRSEVLIATKGGLTAHSSALFSRPDYSSGYLRSAIDRSLERLRTDYIDLYQLHNPPQKLAKEDEPWDELAALQREGKIRYFGVSVRTPNDALAYLRADAEAPGRCGDTLQVAYNLLDQEAAHKGVFVQAHRQDMGVIARVPLASGLLTGKYSADHYFPPEDFRADWPRERLAETVQRVDDLRFLVREDRSMAQTAIAFVLSQEAVSTVITGAKTAAQVEENAAASAFAPLAEADLRAAFELSQ